MARKIASLILVVVLVGLIAGPVQAKRKKPKGPVPVTTTYYLNWLGDCTGTGYLALAVVANADSCALYFPGLGDTYSFSGAEGLPFALDSSQQITVDFSLSHVASAAADFEVILAGTLNGEDAEIAKGTQTVLASGPGATPVHYDLDPDKALEGKQVTALTLTVSWTNGVTYSTMDLDSGTATIVIHGRK